MENFAGLPPPALTNLNVALDQMVIKANACHAEITKIHDTVLAIKAAAPRIADHLRDLLFERLEKSYGNIDAGFESILKAAKADHDIFQKELRIHHKRQEIEDDLIKKLYQVMQLPQKAYDDETVAGQMMKEATKHINEANRVKLEAAKALANDAEVLTVAHGEMMKLMDERDTLINKIMALELKVADDEAKETKDESD